MHAGFAGQAVVGSRTLTRMLLGVRSASIRATAVVTIEGAGWAGIQKRRGAKVRGDKRQVRGGGQPHTSHDITMKGGLLGRPGLPWHNNNNY